MLSKHKTWVLLPALALTLAACGSSEDNAADESPSGDADLTVGVSWNNFNEERWAKADEPAMKEVFEAEGVDVHQGRRRLVRREAAHRRREPHLPGR